MEGDNVEIIVVDDGSPTEPFHNDQCQVIRLPEKQIPKTPTLPFNTGVKAAQTKLVMLVGSDIRPRWPVASMMKKSWHHKAYVQALVLGPAKENKKRDRYSVPVWNSHPDRRIEFFPGGFSPNHCALISKKDFLSVGGFNEEFRDGQAFDDTDFAWKLKRNCFRPYYCMRALTDHIKDGARSNWPEGAWKRNFDLFQSKRKRIRL
jgi:glycosyltransferase involved in cell wall biosynthesis